MRWTIVLLAIFLVACAAPQEVENTTEAENTRNDSENESKVVALVNGDKIFEEDVSRMQTAATQRGAQMGREQVVEQVVMQKLLIQEAVRRGINVSETKIDLTLAEQVPGGAETLQQRMGEERYANVRQQVREQLLLQQLSTSLSRNVTDESAEEFFEKNKENLTDNASLEYEDVAGEVKEYLNNLYASQALEKLAKELRAEAKVIR